jgi:hypothetical protein
MAKKPKAQPKQRPAFVKRELVDNARHKWKAFSVIGLALLTALGASGVIWANMVKVVDPFWYAVGVFVIGFAGLVGAFIKQPTVTANNQ